MIPIGTATIPVYLGILLDGIATQGRCRCCGKEDVSLHESGEVVSTSRHRNIREMQMRLKENASLDGQVSLFQHTMSDTRLECSRDVFLGRTMLLLQAIVHMLQIELLSARRDCLFRAIVRRLRSKYRRRAAVTCLSQPGSHSSYEDDHQAVAKSMVGKLQVSSSEPKESKHLKNFIVSKHIHEEKNQKHLQPTQTYCPDAQANALPTWPSA